MKLKQTLLAAMTALVLVGGCTATSDPANAPGAPSNASADSVRAAVQERLGADAKIGEVRRTPAGVWEVQVGRNIAYTDDQANYLFVGRLIDLRTHENLTEARVDELNRIDFKTLPLDSAIKMVKGKGERTLVVFADPNCRYCKVLEQESLNGIDNVSVYTFLIPILAEDSLVKSRQIWCASDRLKAWDAWMLRNQAPMGRTDCATPIEKVVQLAEQLGVTSTPTLFFTDGGRAAGALPTDQLEERLARASTAAR